MILQNILLHPTLWARHLTVFFLPLFLFACSEATSESDPSALDASPAPEMTPAEISAAKSLSDAVEKLTGNHSRAVWAKTTKEGGTDTYVNGNSHVLMGFDSRDGGGVRILLGEKSNYARPLLSPDGDYVVFTNKNIERDKKNRKHYAPIVWTLPFDSTKPARELAAGYASDIWRDPETKVDWVYAVRDFTPSSAGAIEGKILVRFQLHDPAVEETVWKRTPLNPDNIQLSRDGTRASGQFPWPTGGYRDLENGEWEKLVHGCWTSYAPDNSHVAWVFDGAHRNLSLFSTRTEKKWKVKLTSAPGTEGKELYHPRWTNHPRMLALTGPYQGVKGREIQITKGGQHAEIYIGRFSPALDSIEAWVQLTDDSQGDFYPDVWIADGNEVDLTDHPQLGASKKGNTGSKGSENWPIAATTKLFLWKHRAAKNEILTPEAEGQQARQCGLTPHGLARFNRAFGVDLDGGHALPDPTSLAVIRSAIASSGVNLEVLLTPGLERRENQPVLQLGRWLILEKEQQLFLTDLSQNWSSPLSDVTSGTPMHLALHLPEKDPPLAWINGTPHQSFQWTEAPQTKDPNDTIRLGGGSDIAIDHLAISAATATKATWSNSDVRSSSEATLAEARSRTSPPRRHLRARLTATTPIPSFASIDPYTRALVTYAYEDIEILDDGPPIDAPRITVQRWGLMDKNLVPGMPAKVGDTHDLILEPLEDQPQLEGDRAEDDVLDFTSPAFYLAE